MIKKILMLVVAAAMLFSGYIRVAQTKDFQFPLTYDQSRDLLDMRVPGTLKHFPVIGPTTSINGLYLGPGYYYFNLPAFWMGRGNPQALINWNILWFVAAGGLIFWFFYKDDVYLGTLAAVIYLFSPQMFDTTRYFWNAHSMIYSMVFYFLAMWWFSKKATAKTAWIWGMTAGFSMQFEAAMGIVAVAFSFIAVVLASRDRKIIGYYVLGVLPWFLPQIAVELGKGFRMTKLLVNEAKDPVMLGEKLTLAKAFWSHKDTFEKYFEGQFILNMGLGKMILAATAILGIISKKYRTITNWFLAFILFAFGFYLAGYRHELKIWYAESLRVWYVFVVAIGLMSYFDLIKKYRWVVGMSVVILGFFLGRNVWLTYYDQKQFINNANFAKDDPKLMDHEIKVVDWVYTQTKGEGFRAYNYVPEIYDFPYQYVYWWYGKVKYGYIPGDISYEPNVPQYIVRQKEFYKYSKDSINTIALVYEPKSNYKGWLNLYKGYCIVSKKEFTWNVVAEIRTKCN